MLQIYNVNTDLIGDIITFTAYFTCFMLAIMLIMVSSNKK